MLTIEADIYEYVRMSYVDKNILGPLVHMDLLLFGKGVNVRAMKVPGSGGAMPAVYICIQFVGQYNKHLSLCTRSSVLVHACSVYILGHG